MKWPQSGEPLSLIGGCGRGGVSDWRERLAAFSFASPLSKPTEISQTEMWIVNSGCEVAFFPKLLPKCWQFMEGLNEAWMVNRLSTLYLQKEMKKAFISSPKIGPTANLIPLSQGTYSSYRSSYEPNVGLQLSPLLIMPSSLLKACLTTFLQRNCRKSHSIQVRYTLLPPWKYNLRNTMDLY